MAVLDFHRATGRTSSSKFARLASAAVSSILTWNDIRRTEKALSQLSSHELDDIGLSRGDISSISHRKA